MRCQVCRANRVEKKALCFPRSATTCWVPWSRNIQDTGVQYKDLGVRAGGGGNVDDTEHELGGRKHAHLLHPKRRLARVDCFLATLLETFVVFVPVYTRTTVVFVAPFIYRSRSWRGRGRGRGARAWLHRHARTHARTHAHTHTHTERERGGRVSDLIKVPPP